MKIDLASPIVIARAYRKKKKKKGVQAKNVKNVATPFVTFMFSIAKEVAKVLEQVDLLLLVCTLCMVADSCEVAQVPTK